MTAKSLLLTFRLDQEQRQRLRARLAREGRTMSEVVTHGLRQYVQRARHAPVVPDPGGPVLPERIAGRLRELRSSGRSDLLSAGLAAAAAGRGARRQQAGRAAAHPPPDAGRVARPRHELRAPAAVPAPP